MVMTKEERAAFMKMVRLASNLVYLSCRVGGTRHRWVRCIPDFDPAYKGTYAVVHQCDECTTIKREVVTKQGERLGKPDYDYPDGYKVTKDDDDDSPFATYISPQAVRAAMLARTDVSKLPALKLVSRIGGS